MDVDGGRCRVGRRRRRTRGCGRRPFNGRGATGVGPRGHRTDLENGGAAILNLPRSPRLTPADSAPPASPTPRSNARSGPPTDRRGRRGHDGRHGLGAAAQGAREYGLTQGGGRPRFNSRPCDAQWTYESLHVRVAHTKVPHRRVTWSSGVSRVNRSAGATHPSLPTGSAAIYRAMTHQ